MKKILSIVLVISLVFSIGINVLASENIHKNEKDPIKILNGFAYDNDGNKISDISIEISELVLEKDEYKNLSGKVKLQNETWGFALNNFEKKNKCFHSPTKLIKKHGEKTIKKEGEITFTENLDLISGFIDTPDNNTINFTAGEKASTYNQLKDIYNQLDITSDKGFTIESTDPAIRATLDGGGVYAHIVGPASLSTSENDAVYQVRAWLKENWDTKIGGPYSVRYQNTYYDPDNYTTGGLSVNNVYPKSSSSSISFSIAYQSISASVNFPSSPNYEIGGRNESYVKNYSNGYDPQDYYVDYDSGIDGVEGIGTEFYTYMMGGSTSGTKYDVDCKVEFKIYDYSSHLYLTQYTTDSFSVECE